MSDFLSHPIPAVVILLGVLVLVHELGHYLVGRASGIAVETFSIGFGPRILGFHWHGSEYRISWIPLGGYVKFAGMHPSEDVPDGLRGIAYRDASLPRRAATIIAGPAANFLLAVVVYTTLGLNGVPHPPALIGDVIEGSAAEAAGVKFGDRFVHIGDRAIASWHDIEETISSSAGRELVVTVMRDGAEKVLHLTPTEVKTTDLAGRAVSIGRAGIALGRLPAIITVTGAETPAAAAGIQTGDQVIQLAYGGKKLPIASYAELARDLAEASRIESEGTVSLTVAQATLPSELADKSDKPEPLKATKKPGGESLPNAHTVVLDLRSTKALGTDDSGKTVMRQLGLGDSQLTVAEATETLTGVLQKGDKLLSWNQVPLRDVFTLREQLIANNAESVVVQVLRDFQTKDLTLQLKGIEVQKPEGLATIYTLPVYFWGQPEEPDPIIEKYDNPIGALGYGLRETGTQTKTLFNNVKSLVTGDIPLKALGGPMLIAKVAGDSARRGWQTFLGSLALISINLGLLNLFPIPVLDGGQLVLMGAEALKRRPLRETAIENFQKVGFAMIMALVVLATYNDLSRFWKSMLGSIVGLFQ